MSMGKRLQRVKAQWKCLSLIPVWDFFVDLLNFLYQHLYKIATFYVFEKQLHKAWQKMYFWAGVDKINNHYQSGHDLEVIEKLKWGLERHCNLNF